MRLQECHKTTQNALILITTALVKLELKIQGEGNIPLLQNVKGKWQYKGQSISQELLPHLVIKQKSQDFQLNRSVKKGAGKAIATASV